MYMTIKHWHVIFHMYLCATLLEHFSCSGQKRNNITIYLLKWNITQKGDKCRIWLISTMWTKLFSAPPDIFSLAFHDLHALILKFTVNYKWSGSDRYLFVMNQTHIFAKTNVVHISDVQKTILLLFNIIILFIKIFWMKVVQFWVACEPQVVTFWIYFFREL